MSTFQKPVRLLLTIATALLCAMSSLQALAVTADEIDAKVDVALLQTVAQPWPEGAPC